MPSTILLASCPRSGGPGPELLKAEKATMAKIKHPFIVGLRWAWQTLDRAFLVMDYMPVRIPPPDPAAHRRSTDSCCCCSAQSAFSQMKYRCGKAPPRPPAPRH